MDLQERYSEIREEKNRLEKEIFAYRSFREQLNEEFCNLETTGYGHSLQRKLDSETILTKYRQMIGKDDYIEQILSQDTLSGTEVRKIANYCSEYIASRKENKNELLEERADLEKLLGFKRHPKKDENLLERFK